MNLINIIIFVLNKKYMCISQILEYLVFIQNTETGVLLGRACIKYKYKCIEKIYIAERKKICILYV